ncbi:ROK family transcriptional regulator [Streptacidiphilus albus]|uniref:ROK family transcriptional regulator n=1 Tax=Streptacidiphilus albus TaxID=105425 RepID=UPI00054C4A82|nr:ROK family transcriptional regulator [Streptacidiphilus albus]
MKTATPATARAINDRLALDLLLAHGPLTAPQLRDLTGLSRPTVADLVERLRAAGLVEAGGETGEERRGPNARLYALVADRALVAGVDIRRSGIAVTVADLTGSTVGSAARPLPRPPAGGEVDLPALVAEAVAEAAAGRTLQVVAVGAPGLMHPRTRAMIAGNDVPGWRADLLPELGSRLGAGQVLLENEVNLAAIAEHRTGAATGSEDFVLLWLENEGVGGAVVLGGRLRRGVSGGAGELGLLDIGGESFCETVDLRAVLDLPREQLADRIARGLFAVVAVLDPGLIVLGGSTGRAGGEALAALVAERVALRSLAPTEIRPSTVEGNAVLQGAVLTALDLARDEVFG